MKIKSTKLIPIAAFVCLVMASCKKSDSVAPASSIDQQLTNVANLIDLGMDELVSSDLDDDDDSDNGDNATISNGNVSNSVVKDGNVSNGVACAVVTYSDPNRKYPFTKTIDYGTGCTVAPGLTISGKKIFQKKANWRNASNGTLIETQSFSGYKKNDLTITGNISIYVYSGAGTSNVVLRIVVTQSYRDIDGNTSSFISQGYKKILAGGSTPKVADDIYSLTGTSYGVTVIKPVSLKTVSGWNATIDNNNPLIKVVSDGCKFRASGSLNIKVTYTDLSVDHMILNYGDGTCDNTATLQVNSDAPQSVTLPFVFFNAKI